MDETRPSTLSRFFTSVVPAAAWGQFFGARSFAVFPNAGCCPICDLKFARKQAIFVGAMYISYGIALLVITLNRCPVVGGDRLGGSPKM